MFLEPRKIRRSEIISGTYKFGQPCVKRRAETPLAEIK